MSLNNDSLLNTTSVSDKLFGDTVQLTTLEYDWRSGVISAMDFNDSGFSPLPPEPASGEVIVLLSLLFIVIGTVGLLGNGLVIIVILFDRKMRQSVTNIFIMNLATADFIIMLIGIPEIVQFMVNRGWLLGPALCRVNRFSLVVCLYVSILSLVSVCIER